MKNIKNAKRFIYLSVNGRTKNAINEKDSQSIVVLIDFNECVWDSSNTRFDYL